VTKHLSKVIEVEKEQSTKTELAGLKVSTSNKEDSKLDTRKSKNLTKSLVATSIEGLNKEEKVSDSVSSVSHEKELWDSKPLK